MPGFLYRTGAPFDVQLVIFGKDGTLLDSEAVRLPALKECTAAIAHTAGEPALLLALLKAGGWEDTEKGPTLDLSHQYLGLSCSSERRPLYALGQCSADPIP